MTTSNVHTRKFVQTLQDTLEGALYALDVSIDGFGPSRETAIADIRWAIAEAKSWRRRAEAKARQEAASSGVTRNPAGRQARLT